MTSAAGTDEALQQAITILRTVAAGFDAQRAAFQRLTSTLDDSLAATRQLQERLVSVEAQLADRALSGWKEIVPFLEELGRPCTERHARRLARRPHDPLPIRYIEGRPKALRAEVREWHSRSITRRPCPPVSARPSVIVRRREQVASA